MENQNQLMDALLALATPLLNQENDGRQTVIIRTASGKTYQETCTLSAIASGLQEQALTQKLQGDEHICGVIAVWHGAGVDMLSHTLCKALLALHSENENAIVVLRNALGYNARTLKSALPSKKKD